MLQVNEVAPSSELSQSDYDVDSVCSSEEDVIVESTSSSDMVLKYTLWVVYLALWITVYIIAIELQFGIVYLMLSGLVAIYFNTRTGPKKANEVSAYSVFNKDCQSIDGTLKAEQFEREMGIR